MNIDVGKAITELLFEHDTVILPGLGGFTASPESATVDYVQGVVTPPAKKLAFNPNLVLNDGILVGHIQKRDVVTVQQATEAVNEYVVELKAALDRREIIEIPTVGRIYRDYEKQLKFMPEGTNFEASSFGLPDVKFTPVERVKKPEPETAAPAPKKVGKVAAATQVANAAAQKAEKKAVQKASSSDFISKLLPVLIVLAALLLAFSLYMILRGENTEPVATVGDERVNVKPLETETEGGETISSEEANVNADDAPNEDTTEKVEESETEPAPASPTTGAMVTVTAADGKMMTGDFIVVHSFGVANNAKKFENKLKRGGYEVRSVQHEGLQRVGVPVKGKTKSEVENLIAELGKKYGSTPRLVAY